MLINVFWGFPYRWASSTSIESNPLTIYSIDHILNMSMLNLLFFSQSSIGVNLNCFDILSFMVIPCIYLKSPISDAMIRRSVAS